MEKSTHTQGRQTHHVNPAQVHKSPTTPGYYDLLKNWHIPRADGPPPCINQAQVYRAINYTMYSMSYWEIDT